jgi:GTPase SAR1 family protein
MRKLKDIAQRPSSYDKTAFEIVASTSATTSRVQPLTIKLAFIGDANVGKTTMLKRFTDSEFIE